jgi:hypothetical protein
VTWHGLPNSRIADLLRSAVNLDHHPPEGLNMRVAAVVLRQKPARNTTSAPGIAAASLPSPSRS